MFLSVPRQKFRDKSLINPDAIIYVVPIDTGGSDIHFVSGESLFTSMEFDELFSAITLARLSG
jgi:hypothetical protein